MKFSPLCLLLGAAILLFNSCEKEFFGNRNTDCNLDVNGPTVTQTLDLATIHALDIDIPIELTLIESATQEIEIESTQSIIDAIIEKSSVQNGEWEVKVGCDNISNGGGFPVLINASLSSLSSIKIAGSGKVNTINRFKNINNLNLDISGSGEIDIAVDSINDLQLEINGSGKFTCSGFAETTNMDISGSGNFFGFDFIINECKIAISGSGECDVHVLETLEIDISGSANVCYKGQPRLNFDIAGSGRVMDCN